jgi:hypothetical protein
MKTFRKRSPQRSCDSLATERASSFVLCVQRPSTLTISACVRARSAALCMDKPAGTFF